MSKHLTGTSARLQPRATYGAGFTQADRQRLDLLNSRPSPCLERDWPELLELGIKERKSHRSSWELISGESSSSEVYDDLWQEVKIRLLGAQNKTLPKLPAYFDKVFLNEFRHFVKSAKRRYGITQVPADDIPHVRTEIASDIQSIDEDSENDPLERLRDDAISNAREEQEIAMLKEVDNWQELMEIRARASQRYGNRNKVDWRNHWLPYLYYRARRVNGVEDAAELAGVTGSMAAKLEAFALSSLLAIDPTLSSSEVFAPDIQHDYFPYALRSLRTDPGQHDAFQYSEWLGLRCDPIENRRKDPIDALHEILNRKHLKSVISKFENMFVAQVRIERQREGLG